MIKLLLFVFILGSCSMGNNNKKLTKKELEIKQIEALQKIRPILKSDDFQFMKCDEIEKIFVEDEDESNIELWKNFGAIKLRMVAIEKESNYMTLSHQSFGKVQRYSATLYRCEDIKNASKVEDIGMCKASEQRVFTIKYSSDASRSVGEEIIKTKIRYHAIANHYKTYSVKDLKYSFTKKTFSANAGFYKCY